MDRTEATAAKRATRKEAGSELVRLRVPVIIGVGLVSGALLVLYALFQFWPPAPPAALAGPTTTTAETTTTGPGATTTTTTTGPTTTTSPTTTVVLQPAANPPFRVFWMDLALEREVRLFYVVALAGALGGLAHALRSLFWYTGNRALKSSWLLMYGLLPFVGAALAVITYMVLRGGVVLVSTQTSADVVNPFGYASLAGLVGLFSSEAAEWLRKVFAQVFTLALKGKDAAIQPTIGDVRPPNATAGTEVVVTGTGLAEVTTVMFGQVAAKFEPVSETQLKATVPAEVATGPVTLTVTVPAGSASTSFTVDPPARPVDRSRTLLDRLQQLLGRGRP